MKTRWIAGTVVVLLCVAALAIALRSKKRQDVRIGAVLPLTGDLAIYGQKMKRGIDLAISQANRKGGVAGRPVQVDYEDDQGDPKTSIAAAQKLITVNEVKVIIGGAISATALPCIPIIDRSHVVLFSPAATSPNLSGASKYFFRNWPPDTYDGTAMGEFAAKSLHIKEAAVLYVNNEWGVAISKIFTDTLEASGGKVTITESYEPNATDFRTQLTKIADRRPEAIYIPGYLKELITILRQKQELRISAKILSAYGFYDPQILQQDGGAAEGAIFTAPAYDPDSQDPEVNNFVTVFHKTYGDQPDIWAAQAYDAARIVLSALHTGASTGPEIRNAVADVKDFEGVSGRTSFDARGDVQKPLRFMTVRRGQFANYTLEK
jgi:branched-chain amino acid transport system substrate-binding protein